MPEGLSYVPESEKIKTISSKIKGEKFKDSIKVNAERQRGPSQEGRPFEETDSNKAEVTIAPDTLNDESLKESREVEEDKYVSKTEAHGRDVSERAVSNKVLWADEYGIPYGDRNFKGNVMDRVEISADEYGLKGLRGQGLKESDNVHLIRYNSDWMREEGLPTEKITDIKKLKEVIVDGEIMTVEDWAKKRHEKNTERINYYKKRERGLEEKLEKMRKRKNGFLGNVLVNDTNIEQTEKSLEANRKYIKASEDLDKREGELIGAGFYVIERDLQVAERMSDLNGLSEEDTKKRLGEVFNWVNALMESRGTAVMEDMPAVESFDIENDEDIKRYLLTVSKWMGHYMGKFHKLKGVHGFAHDQNWSLVGTLYDLDSVKRVEEITPDIEKKQQNDVELAVGSLHFLLDNSYFRREFGDIFPDVQVNFAKEYIKTRFGDDLSDDELDKIREGYFSNASTRYRTMAGARDIAGTSESGWNEVVKSLRS